MKLHSAPEKVIGPGARHFLARVNVSGCNDNRCFWVLRNDDTFDDFSGRSA